MRGRVERGLWLCVHYSAAGVDIQSQEAYELACQGLLRPVADNQPAFAGPVLYDIRCIHFRPPDFTLGQYNSLQTDRCPL